MPVTIGQSVTTVTSASTVTTQATFTQESQYPVATTSATSMVEESIVEGTITMGGVGIRFCDMLRPISFDATAGDQVKGIVQSSIANTLTFYIVSDQQYKIWFSNKSPCDPETSGATALVSAKDVPASYNLAWTVPADGTYWLTFEVYSEKTSVVTASITKTSAQLVTSVIYSTQSSLVALTATKTLTSIFTQSLVAPAPIGTFTLVAVGIIVLVAVGGAYFVVSKRKPKM